jgi:acetoin utilization protein AcuB
MKVSKLMSRKLITVTPDDSVERAVQLLRQRGVRHLLVLKDGRLVGIVSDRDLKRALDPAKVRKRKLLNLGGLFFLLEPFLIREIMSRDVVSIDPNATAQMAASLMLEMKFGALPVVKNNRLLGIITETDLLKYFAMSPPTNSGQGNARNNA